MAYAHTDFVDEFARLPKSTREHMAYAAICFRHHYNYIHITGVSGFGTGSFNSSTQSCATGATENRRIACAAF